MIMLLLSLLNLPGRPGLTSSLTAWDDSLRAVRSTSALAALDAASRSGPSFDGVRRALYTLRLGELTHEYGVLDANVSPATVVSRHHSDWVWGPWILARSFAALAANPPAVVRPDDGRGIEERYSDAAWRTLDLALQRDPQFLPARQLMLHLLVAGGDRLLRDHQLAMLQRDLSRNAPDPDALLVLGRQLRMQRRYDSALVTFTRAIALGGDRSRLALERARTMRALHDSAGAGDEYWYGAAHLTPGGRELYRYDLAWIISPDSLRAFDAIPDSAVVQWLQRFWEERDAAAANHPGERLNEHLRRWVVAYARYRTRSPWRRTVRTHIDPFFENLDCIHLDAGLYEMLWKLPPVHDDDIRRDEWLIDHRGLLYLRHGEPLQRLGMRGPAPGREDFTSGPPSDLEDTSPVWWAWDFKVKVPPMAYCGGVPCGPPRAQPVRYTEGWVYLMDGTERVLNFRNSNAIGSYAATTVASVLPFNPSVAVARSDHSINDHKIGDRALEMLWQVHNPDGVPEMPQCWVETKIADAASREAAHIGISSDTDAPPFVHLIPGVLRIYALGDGATEPGKAVVATALQGVRLHADSIDGGRLLYTIAYRVVAWESATGRTQTIDTVRRFVRNAPIPAGEFLTALLELPLEPADWVVAIRAQQGDSSGAMAVRRDVHVAAAAIPSLSDIVLGQDGEPAWRAPDGAPFALNYTGAWPLHSVATLYYETYGMLAGTAYKTSVDIKSTDPKNRSTVKLAFDARATGAVTPFRRAVDLSQLPAGTYELRVTIDAGGKLASRAQQLVITGAKIGGEQR